MAKSSLFSLSDFSGGFFGSNVPSERMKDNELLQAENCFYRSRLYKRGGRSVFASVAGSVIQGAIRTQLMGSWYTVLAVDTGGAVELRYGTGTSFVTAPYPAGTAHTLTTGKNIQFAALGENVVAVNGTDKPRIIYEHSAGIVADTIERYDTRYRYPDNWYAGQYAASTPTYTDDTTHAQDDTSSNFEVAASQSGHGCFVACDLSFNKVVFVDTGAGSNTTPQFEYYGRVSNSGALDWQTWTAIVSPATWGGAAGDRTLEFNIPQDANDGTLLMEPYDADEGDLTNRYCMRLQSLTAPSAAINCGKVEVYHTQYLSELCLADKPDTVAEHKNHLFLGMGNWVRISPRNQLKNWRSQSYEWFKDGGDILAMVPHYDYLAILLETAIYGLGGTSWADWVLRYLGPCGIIAKRGAVQIGQLLFYVGRDGIYYWDGKHRIRVSKHIGCDSSNYTMSSAVLTAYDDLVYASFPDNTELLLFDPDTIREDDEGDARVSFFKYPSWDYDKLLHFSGAGDTGHLYGIYNPSAGNPKIHRLENPSSHQDDLSTTAPITMKVQTRYFDGGDSFVDKIVRRLKVRISDVSATGGVNYTFKTFSLHERGISSYSQTVEASALASGVHIEDLTPGHRVDGKNISVYMEHAGSTTAVLYGLGLDMEMRRY